METTTHTHLNQADGRKKRKQTLSPLIINRNNNNEKKNIQ